MTRYTWVSKSLGLGGLVAGATACTATMAPTVEPPDPAPHTIIESAPPALSNQALARFVLASDIAGATFVCNVDDAPLVACDLTFEVTLADGPHQLTARAVSPRGVVDVTPAHYAWQIDTVGPLAAITSSPPALDNTAAPRFEFVSEPGATLTCAIDGGAPVACASPYVTPLLTNGSHVFAVTATDLAGNVEQVPATYQWTIDLSVADTAIDNGPAGLVGLSTAAFRFSSPNAEPGATFRCALDGAVPTFCTSPMPLTGLADGTHTFEVEVVEPAGTVDPTPATRTWQIDATPPAIEVAGSMSLSNSSVQTFAFTVTGAPPELIECGIKVGSTPIEFAPCKSPYTTPALPDGLAGFQVRARDEAGNLAASGATVVIDTMPPVLAIEVFVGDVSSQTRPVYEVFAPDAASLTCDLNGVDVACNDEDPELLALSDGSYTFTAHAVDAAGNVSLASQSFTIDTAVPKLELDVDANALTRITNEASPMFRFPSDAGATLACSLDGAPLSACTSPVTVGPLPNGSHQFAVHATDLAGRVAVFSQQIFVDARAPSLAVTDGPDGATTDSHPRFAWSAPGGITPAECRYDNDIFVPCDKAMDRFLDPGPHTFQVEVDGDQRLVAGRSFTIGPIPLVTTMRSGPSGTITTPSISFSFDVSDDSAVTECRVFPAGPAQGDFAPCTSPFSTELPASGAYVFEVRAQDAAGSRSSAFRAVTLASP